MMNSYTFEDQLDQIRVDMYERMKKLSASETVNVLNRRGKEVAEKYGIAITKTVPAP